MDSVSSFLCSCSFLFNSTFGFPSTSCRIFLILLSSLQMLLISSFVVVQSGSSVFSSLPFVLTSTFWMSVFNSFSVFSTVSFGPVISRVLIDGVQCFIILEILSFTPFAFPCTFPFQNQCNKAFQVFKGTILFKSFFAIYFTPVT